MLTKFDPSKIYCNEKAKQEAKRLKEIAINNKSSKWQVKTKDILKVSILNIRSFKKHVQDLKNDHVLQESDVISLSETWLDADLEMNFGKFSCCFLNRGVQGLALLSVEKPNHVSFGQGEASVMLTSFVQFDLISIYKPHNITDTVQFTESVTKMLNFNRTILISGDVNIDILQEPNNIFTATLIRLGFKQLVKTATHEKGGLLDHVYFFSPYQFVICEICKVYSVYYSDHDAITLFLDFSKIED